MVVGGAVADCLSKCGSSFVARSSSSSSSSICGIGLRLNLNSNLTRTIRPRRAVVGLCVASLITNSDSFEVGRLIGSYGFMNVISYSGLQSGMGMDYAVSEDIGNFKVQDIGEGSVKIRLYEGRVAQGPLRGTRVIFKVYPGQQVGGTEADMMAANELNAHASLQSNPKDVCPHIQALLGGFETKTREQVCLCFLSVVNRSNVNFLLLTYVSDDILDSFGLFKWLAFRDIGKYSAADYAKITSENMSKMIGGGEQRLWNPFELDLTIKRRRYFVVRLLHGTMRGLSYMHDNDRLHQSLGPASVVLNTVVEKDAPYLIPRLRDLAFSVDIRYSQLEDRPSILSEGLWRRASVAGASSPLERRAFGIADDIYEAGLLFAYLAFVPFCEAGVMDSISLRRLLENTFQLDLQAAREYCSADDRLLEAVKFLDLGDGAGWELLQAMLNRDYRGRPIAEAVVNHRFLSGTFL